MVSANKPELERISNLHLVFKGSIKPY